MNQFADLADIRRDYGSLSLSEEAVALDPIEQFSLWFAEELAQEKNDPNAMVLSTVDEQGRPDSRVVLLKGLEEGYFIFYTNYLSTKAKHMDQNPNVALNFYWPKMARQVRVQGQVEKVSAEQSDRYFSSRPVKSQIGAIVSPQSQKIKDRAFLEKALSDLEQNQDQLVRPECWGGYRVIPDHIEFWQGRDNRLHDRIQYLWQNNQWSICRLAP